MKKLYIVAILCILAMLFVPASAENVYVDRNPAIFDVKPAASYGMVEFFVRACGSAQDLTVWIKSNNEKNLTFDPTFRFDGSSIKDQNEGFLQVEVQPDCLSVPMILAAGEYTAYMQNGNGNQMEERTFKIGGGGTERVSFLGAAVTTAKNYCDHRYHVLKATYGADDECITVVNVPAHTEYAYWISDTPAHTEYRYRDWVPEVCYPEVNHTEMVGNTTHTEMVGNTTHQEWVPEVNHTEWVEDGHYYVYDWKLFWGYLWKVRCTNHAEHGDGWHYQTSACTEAYGHWITVVDVPGHYIEVDNMDGHVIDVDNMDGQLVIVVDQEAYCDPGYWGDWSDWSDDEVDPIPKEREVETRFVPADMYSGHYSDWSDTPEGLCLMVREDGIIQIPHDPCITRWVEATYKQECSDAMIDVTAEVQSVIDMGYLKFYFDNNGETDGIFAEGGELLVTIEDPAPQYPKTAYINYEDRCGNSQRVKEYSVSGGEGVLFDLEAGTPGCPHIIKKS